MSRLMVVSGLHLDRSWPDLSLALGRRLRAWSVQMLTEVITSATRHRADGIVVLGELFARETVLPSTVDQAIDILGRFSGKVMIAPGPGDPIEVSGPFARGEYPENVHVWTTTEFSETPWFEGVFGAACLGAGPRPSLPPAVPEHAVYLHPAMPSTVQRDLSRTAVTVTSHIEPGSPGAGFIVPPLVGPPTGRPRRALIVQLDRRSPSIHADVVGMRTGPGRLLEINVDGLTEGDELLRLVTEQTERAEPAIVRLVGTLPPGVLLPSGTEHDGHSVTFDLEGLVYANTQPDAADHSVRAEFLRAMTVSPYEPRIRHQVTARGLLALDTEL